MVRARALNRPATYAIALLLVIFTAAATWAAVDDYLQRDILPKGATVAGVDIGGMTRAAATRVIEEQVKGPLLTPVAVTFRGKSTAVDPSSMTKVDVESLIANAALPKATAPLPQRILWRVTDLAYGRETTGVISVETTTVAAWIKAEKRRLSIPAVDATVSVKGSKLTIKPSQAGVSFNSTRAIADLSKALLAGTKTVALVETTTSPKVTTKKLGKTIFVSTSKKTLKLYNGTKLEQSYSCAVGMPGYPTPLGWWKIVQRRYLPTWVNPGSGWGEGMPATIPPGPNNPLGTRALNLDASGIRIHGTSADFSIGTAASHGCMRMHMWDIEDLYPRVPLGTRVIIVS